MADLSVWYDTREGLQARLQSGGLSGLREIAKARREAGYDRREKLKEWYILGIFCADSVGNFSLITGGAPLDASKFLDYSTPPVPDVMSREEMGTYTQRWEITHGACLPPGDDRCDRCGRGWTLDNVRDFFGELQTPRHLSCHWLAVIERERSDMVEIVKRSEIPYTDIYMIPNEYARTSDYYGPWFMIVTAAGRIRIGWRKRVILIDWSETAFAAMGDAVVDKPEVTHGAKYVHAWSAQKAIEALRKLWAGGTGS